MAKICLITLVITVISFTHGQHSQDENYPQALVFCKPGIKNEIRAKTSRKTHQRSLLFISTLDGKITALDADSGQYVWSIVTGPGKLLSSSISKIEFPSAGQWTRLVPTLEGDVYRLNGNGFEAMPFSADTLLENSLKVDDDVIITGGKDNRGYGIDYKNGKLKYICSMEGCKFFGNDVVNQDNVLVIKRFTNIIRAADPKTGLEKWNFSVSHHDLHFIDNTPEVICDEPDDEAVESTVIEDLHDTELDIKIIIPTGMVMAFLPDSRKTLLWQHKFDSPVANAWMMQNGELKKINLLENFQPISSKEMAKDSSIESASIYLGVHQQQLYIQQSPEFRQKIKKAIFKYTIDGEDSFPRIQWKPYMHTAFSRTPLIMGNHLPEGESENIINWPNRNEENTALMIRHDSDYPYDGGYYILPEETFLDSHLFLLNDTENIDENSSVEQIIIVSLWYWWKELLGLAVLTLIINLTITRYYWKTIKHIKSEPKEEENTVEEKMSTLTVENKILPEFKEEFVSRYYTEFEPIQRLGKGGFGVVYQARKKFDGCEYAIKRICIPNRTNAREKVMREVKALAKLDHMGIVRYFNAWFESPPPGWQEEMDKYWEESDVLSSNVISSDCSIEIQPKILNFPSVKHSKKMVCNSVLKQGNVDTDLNFNKKDDESGSYSFDPRENPLCLSPLSPFESGDNNEVTYEEQQTLPFKNYKDPSIGDIPKLRSKRIDSQGDSFIVFEDSGCADRSASGEKISLVNKNSDFEIVTHNKENNCDKTEGKKIPVSNDFDCPPSNGYKPSKVYLHIQMQLCQKDNLKDWLNVHCDSRNKFQVLDFFDQIVSAVQYVHDQGLMHRDLKPSNIFFSMNGTIKVGDFGLVTTMAGDIDDRTPVDEVRGKKHTDQVGTQLYMSPEQIIGLTYNHKVDIYSLGLIFFELLMPFKTQMERLQVMVNVKQHTFPDGFEKTHLEEGIFIKQMLSMDPEARPSAVDIKQHSLLQAFQPRPEVLEHRRSRNMSQTYSTSSSGSFDLSNEF